VKGQFQKGRSGNPGGRPKVTGHVRELAQAKSAQAFEKVVSLIDDEDPRVALAAAQEVLNRAYGKPTAHVEADLRVPYVIETPEQSPTTDHWAQRFNPPSSRSDH
jgi:hypothetical protein